MRTPFAPFARLTLALLLAVSGFQSLQGQSGHDWLSKVDDQKTLQSLHIPGTHNSAALHEPLAGTAKCQDLSIHQQLEAGVRFLDIRCRHHEDQFSLYHGRIPQNQTFAELQQTLSDFLTQNPGECLLVSIQETAKPHHNSRSFRETLLSYQAKAPKLWSSKTQLPQLSEVRGKALLVRRFSSKEALGVDATNWKNQGNHPNRHFLIQDRYKLSGPDEKWKALQALWKEAPQHRKLLSLNFASGYQPNKLGIPNITAISKVINLRLKKRLSEKPTPPPGVLVLDFIDNDLAQAIFELNF